MSCQTTVRWFTTGAEAHAWRRERGLPRCALHFCRDKANRDGKGWRMQLDLTSLQEPYDADL